MKIKKLTLALIAFTGISYAQSAQGVWSDSSSTAFSNCYAIFSIENDSVFMTHYIEFNGEPFIEHGSGVVKGDSLIYNVRVTKQIKGWTSTAGLHQLKLSGDGLTLKGSYSDNTGNSGPLFFRRQFPK